MDDGYDQSRSISTTLLRLAKQFDDQAWSRLVYVFSPCVYGWFRRWGIAENDAPDLVQEVFIKLSKSIVKFQRDTPGATFRGWMWTIAKNTSRDHFRKNPQHISMPPDIPDVICDEDASEKAVLLHRVLEMIREDFSERTFEIFRRCELEGQDAKDIANEYGMKWSTVREAKRRVMTRLREECIELLGTEFWSFENRQ